jgi:YVTN family beta-propeller protein
LTVTKHVVCDFTAVPCPTADEFNITATTGNGSSYTFSGSEGGTPLTINPPFPVTYNLTETTAPQGFVTAAIPVESAPIGIAFNPDNGFLYVTSGGAGVNIVSVINGATNTVVGTPIPVGALPRGIAFNPDNGFLYVTNLGDNTVSVIAPLTTTFSEGCNGTIDNAGQAATCTVTNAYGRP